MPDAVCRIPICPSLCCCLNRYLMPWQLPQGDVDKAWSLIYRTTLRWELRYAGGIKLAIDEVRPKHF